MFQNQMETIQIHNIHIINIFSNTEKSKSFHLQYVNKMFIFINGANVRLVIISDNTLNNKNSNTIQRIDYSV